MRTTLMCLLLAGCAGSPLSGLPPETVNAIANAGGGCVRVNGLMGSGVMMIGSADKGVIRNGEVSIADNCGGIIIREAPRPK